MLDGVSPGERIAVAMSGGVDSSVAAALMVEAGYNVVGITLQLYDHGAMISKKGACCAGQDIYDARMVADKMGFPHYVLDYESVFRQKVIDDFADSYLQGETPIPCVRCNQEVKFKDLLQTAKDLDAKALVTGHYVQRFAKERAELHRALDHTRDQSYFLFTTTQDQLDYLRFPLGGLPKSETREHATRFGLTVAEKPDSQDICFVPNGSYASVVSKLRPGALDPGEIIHINGTVLGKHDGIINYTIGQRKGLGIAYEEPLYVVRLAPKKHQVWVGPKEALAVQTIYLKEVNWLKGLENFRNGLTCMVKVRSTHQPISAIVQVTGPENVTVTFGAPEYGVASGQACVFYENNQVLGGGWITSQHLNGGIQ
jgi:tRNA-specific 2-thiouridylase